MNKSYALITGASSGIGLEISNSLAKRGYNILLTSRREKVLKNISINIKKKYNVNVDLYACDLNHEESPSKIYKYCESNGYVIDILVNNAGYAIPTLFHKTSLKDEEDFIRVLGTSVISLSKLFLKNMIENNYGRIMIVSSVAAFAPPSKIQSLYGPIKTFMNRFSESLNLSYNRNGITSTAVCPGYTVTNFHSSSGVQDEMDRVPNFLKKSSKRIAEEAVIATLNGKKVCVPTKTWKIIVFLIKILPNPIFSILSRKMAPGRYEKK
ncbi:MAG: polyketide synthase [Flavobacteriaceae bacterium]|nr:polyketide synthase [Flavobacteriaceae bacterium]|tara:strand:+ start:8220 stop:9020 length:801 start_codon:yes stop_codon:yes gene_type:complete